MSSFAPRWVATVRTGHVVSAIALRDYAAWITGAHFEVDRSRIDFKWDGFAASVPCGYPANAGGLDGDIDLSRLESSGRTLETLAKFSSSSFGKQFNCAQQKELWKDTV